MQNETVKPRLESEESKIRLIDANALLEELRSYGYAETSNAVFSVESAPTVETTDDVLARLPEQSTIRKTVMQFFAYEKKTFGKSAFGKTPLEAVKRLEASLNAK